MPTPNSSTRFAIDIGTVIADTYRIEAMIGRGGMGSVFVASHARLPGTRVAIKVLHTGVEDTEVLARFKREAEIASRLGHPNIVKVLDFNQMPDGTPYLVLEYLHGTTLADRIATGPIPLDQALLIVRQVGSALAAAHREGIVHRDLKPQNIFLVHTEVDGRPVEVAKVLDFGISKIRGSQTVKTQESALLGTPQYMAPEQATGKHDNVDERTDVFAFGAIVHEMLSGYPAFTGASIPEVVFKVVYEPASALPSEVPDGVATTIKRAMAKPSAERFPSVSSFVEALTGSALVSARTDIVPPPSPDAFAQGSKHSHQHALASTLASGNHGPATQFGIAATVDSARLPLEATLPTLPPGAANAAMVAPEVAVVAADARARNAAKDSRSIWGKVLAIGGALGAAAVVLLVFVKVNGGAKSAAPASVDTGAPLAQRGGSPTIAPPPLPDVPTEKPVAPSDVPSDRPSDVPRDVPSDGPSDGTPVAKKQTRKDPRTEAKTPPKQGTLAEDKDDGDALDGAPTFGEIQAAFTRRDADAVIRLAKRIVDHPDARPRARARANYFIGRANCVLRQDVEAARRALRSLEGSPALARKLESECGL